MCNLHNFYSATLTSRTLTCRNTCCMIFYFYGFQPYRTRSKYFYIGLKSPQPSFIFQGAIFLSLWSPIPPTSTKAANQPLAAFLGSWETSVQLWETKNKGKTFFGKLPWVDWIVRFLCHWLYLFPSECVQVCARFHVRLHLSIRFLFWLNYVQVSCRYNVTSPPNSPAWE